jgi:mono/diheme cytochrome c family protein
MHSVQRKLVPFALSVVFMTFGRAAFLSCLRRNAAVLCRIKCVAALCCLNSFTHAFDQSAHFYRAINLNGPALIIDGNSWEAGHVSDLKSQAKSFENQRIPLTPPTDSNRAEMIRSSRWGQNVDCSLQNVPNGPYQVFVYVWEDNASERFAIQLNGKTVLSQYESGAAGRWKRLGPWRTQVVDGSIQLSTRGGAANVSGIEIWSGFGEVPDPVRSQFAASPTNEQLAFFESKIRPLFIEHCYECHSQAADDPGGGLLLDSRAGVLKGGQSEHLLIPGDPDSSLLMRAVRHTSPDLKMPPDVKLEPNQIADLEAWVRMHAPDPRTEDTVAAAKAKTDIDWDKGRDFWSLKPLSSSPAPTVFNTQWPANPIDQFVLAKIESNGLKPSFDADKRTLIRRATFDLIGLPPTPQEIESFVQDSSTDAFNIVLNRLLDSPQYGERWGRHWLDVVRYSDTAGDNSDFPIPQMVLYRDWVIDAFNRDLPYDEFVRQQLAGDLMKASTPQEMRQQIIATGYIANARRFGSRVDDYPQHLTIEDTLDNLGRTFLATTINCARCHNHKFDPVSAEDYYALYGIFHSTRYPWPGIELEQRQRDLVAMAPADEVERIQTERRTRQKVLDADVKRLAKARDEASGETREELTKQHKEAEKIAKKHSRQPLPFETLYAVAESSTIEDVPLQIKGDPLKSGAVVPRRFLKVLHGTELPREDLTSGRMQLADWIVDRNNPLTARVIVNRVWLHHFHRGIVSTPNDFGRQGKPPTHPELLDWLANHFMNSGWSIKQLHRTIMTSRTYRLSSQLSKDAIDKDPTNEWLTAYPRRRLDAEAIRDAMLMLSGKLDSKRPGAHPFPSQSDWQFTQHNPFKAIYSTNARSVYLMTQRIQRHPYLAIFDGADPSVSTPLRTTSTTPLQALYLLNDQFVHEQADGLGDRLLNEANQESKRIEQAWMVCFGRMPTRDEAMQVSSFLSSLSTQLAAEGLADQDLKREVWRSLARSLLRSNELVYID